MNKSSLQLDPQSSEILLGKSERERKRGKSDGKKVYEGWNRRESKRREKKCFDCKKEERRSDSLNVTQH